MVCRVGFEPTTFGLRDRYSDQLSYRRIIFGGNPGTRTPTLSFSDSCAHRLHQRSTCFLVRAYPLQEAFPLRVYSPYNLMLEVATSDTIVSLS